jgi:hypothetical protein
MIELLLPYGFDTLEYSWVKATIGICTLAYYFVAKKCQQPSKPSSHQETEHKKEKKKEKGKRGRKRKAP